MVARRHQRLPVLRDRVDPQGALVNLIDTLPTSEQYSYVFDGNSQVLDQILVSFKLFRAFRSYDSVHVNSEFHDQDSDHEPQVAQFNIGGADED